MFRLSKHVGCNPPGVSLRSNDENFAWACNEVNSNILRHQLLGRCDVCIPRPNDALNWFHGFRPIRHCRDCLRTTCVQNVFHAKHFGDSKNFTTRMRTRNNNVGNACNLGGNHRHEQGTDERITTRGTIHPNGIKWTNYLPQ